MTEDPKDKRTTWDAYRHDCNDGEIRFHAFGPKESFVVFEGVNAKKDCEAFMTAVGGTMP